MSVVDVNSLMIKEWCQYQNLLYLLCLPVCIHTCVHTTKVSSFESKPKNKPVFSPLLHRTARDEGFRQCCLHLSPGTWLTVQESSRSNSGVLPGGSYSQNCTLVRWCWHCLHVVPIKPILSFLNCMWRRKVAYLLHSVPYLLMESFSY